MSQAGRGVSPRDKQIFRELLTYYPKDRIKLDLDIMSEPCIFFRFYGTWDPVYKLSKDGNYSRTRRYYTYQANQAIQQYCKSRWYEHRLNKINYKQEKETFEQTMKMQKQFATEGFKDNLPT